MSDTMLMRYVVDMLRHADARCQLRHYGLLLTLHASMMPLQALRDVTATIR